jgi:forkhead protein FKH
MPPRAKRKTARKSAISQDNSDYELTESSPVRPANKRRKVNTSIVSPFFPHSHKQLNVRTAATQPKTPPSELDQQDGDGDGDGDETNDENETLSQSELIDSVVACFTTSKEAVVVAQEYANDRQQGDSQKIDAFAKIAGRDWTYFVRQQQVNIGRPPDDRQQSNGLGASSPIHDLKEMLPIHIDLGPSKIVSRHHACIFYDAEFPDGGGWHVRVNGRNGVRVNNVLLKRGSRQQIASGTVLEVSGSQMMFVTPGDPVQIDRYFIDNVKKSSAGEDAGVREDQPDQPDQPDIAMPAASYHALAPAPRIFKQERASTPPSQQMDGRGQRAVFDSKTTVSPMYGRGMMMESTQEIDYSRDSAKDLKPPFSYATMIAQAIFSTEEEKMTLANIYSFIADKYAFYRHSNSGWQVSSQQSDCLHS